MSEKSIRRLSRRIGVDLWRAWNHQGDEWKVVTTDHRHGRVDHRTFEVEWEDDPCHFDTCAERFPDFPEAGGSK